MYSIFTMKLDFRIEIFKEDGQFVAIAPELNVSSFGNTQKEAKDSLREAVFLEECRRMGTLEDVLIRDRYFELLEKVK